MEFIGKTSLLFVFLLSLLAHSHSAIADHITIVADEWPPYNYKPNSTEPGYGIEIVTHIFEANGHTVEYKVLPWKRSILETRMGKYNAIIGAVREESPDFIFPEEEFGVSMVAFFTNKGSVWKYNGLDSLLTVKLGLINDYSYGAQLDAFFEANKDRVQYVYGDDALDKNIRKLLSGRFDVLVADLYALLYTAKKIGVSSEIVKAGDTNNADDLYIAFSPKISKSKQYAEMFTEGIRKLKDSGELDKILAKYGLAYWK